MYRLLFAAGLGAVAATTITYAETWAGFLFGGILLAVAVILAGYYYMWPRSENGRRIDALDDSDLPSPTRNLLKGYRRRSRNEQ